MLPVSRPADCTAPSYDWRDLILIIEPELAGVPAPDPADMAADRERRDRQVWHRPSAAPELMTNAFFDGERLVPTRRVQPLEGAIEEAAA